MIWTENLPKRLAGDIGGLPANPSSLWSHELEPRLSVAFGSKVDPERHS
jgi:hypothetical protein